jgi:hypothetical protein
VFWYSVYSLVEADVSEKYTIFVLRAEVVMLRNNGIHSVQWHDLGFITDGEFLLQLSDSQFSKKDLTTWKEFINLQCPRLCLSTHFY